MRTPLRSIPELRRFFGMPRLWIKDEHAQRFGTWKDRRSALIIRRANAHRMEKLVLISAGNAAFSLASFAKRSGIAIDVVLDVKGTPEMLRRLRTMCHRVITKNLGKKMYSSDNLISLVRERSNERIWDVSNGFEAAYESIIEEIKDREPAHIVCPLGSGEAFIGLCNGVARHLPGATVIGVTPSSKRSIADKLPAPWTPYADLLKIVQAQGHRVITVSENQIREAHRLLRRFMPCEPSSAVGLAALLQIGPTEKTVVVINSGVAK